MTGIGGVVSKISGYLIISSIVAAIILAELGVDAISISGYVIILARVATIVFSALGAKKTWRKMRSTKANVSLKSPEVLVPFAGLFFLPILFRAALTDLVGIVFFGIPLVLAFLVWARSRIVYLAAMVYTSYFLFALLMGG
jgi:hypothetical protein